MGVAAAREMAAVLQQTLWGGTRRRGWVSEREGSRSVAIQAEEDYRDPGSSHEPGNYQPVLPVSASQLYCCCLQCWGRLLLSLEFLSFCEERWCGRVSSCVLSEFNFEIILVKYSDTGFRPSPLKIFNYHECCGFSFGF